MAEKTQTLQNHTRLDPVFHFFLAPVALIILGFVIYEAIRDFNWMNMGHVLVALWAFVALFKIRLYPLKVQDRVIRLEEQLRMQKLLPEPLKARIGELTEQQYVALRFASDAELPGLVEQTLAQNLGQKQIKQAIQTWRPDHFRV